MSIEPALTPEEWAKGEIADGDLVMDLHRGVVSIGEISYVYQVWRPHAAAALCLHGQPYGFTWDDVDLLRTVARVTENVAAARMSDSRVWERYTSLADRVAALLPPRES